MISAEEFLELSSIWKNELQERPMGSSLTCHSLSTWLSCVIGQGAAAASRREGT